MFTKALIMFSVIIHIFNVSKVVWTWKNYNFIWINFILS